LSVCRKHRPNEMSVVFGTIVSFSFVLFALLHPIKSFDSFGIYLAASILGFLYFIRKIL
jgi:hypothetical protein